MSIQTVFDYREGTVIIGTDLLCHVADHLDLDRRVLIVTDDGVPEEYSRTVAAQCAKPLIITNPQGENSKSFLQLQKLLSAMLHDSFSRGDCVVAVGGGVVGDLSGFAASCYMRGIDFYNIPTTLLAQIDSSIGGKTAIDLEGVKNIVGHFYQPKKVLIDSNVLTTLSSRQLSAGLAEAIKIAAVCDAELFSMIEALPDLRSDLTEIIGRAVRNKLEIVTADPKENGLRRILNFGHTIGHAIESYYDGKLLHGECVALGMLAMCGSNVRERLIVLLERFGLQTKADIDLRKTYKYLIHDKKSQGELIRTVFVEDIGSFEMRDMSAEELMCRMEGTA